MPFPAENSPNNPHASTSRRCSGMHQKMPPPWSSGTFGSCLMTPQASKSCRVFPSGTCLQTLPLWASFLGFWYKRLLLLSQPSPSVTSSEGSSLATLSSLLLPPPSSAWAENLTEPQLTHSFFVCLSVSSFLGLSVPRVCLSCSLRVPNSVVGSSHPSKDTERWVCVLTPESTGFTTHRKSSRVKCLARRKVSEA